MSVLLTGLALVDCCHYAYDSSNLSTLLECSTVWRGASPAMYYATRALTHCCKGMLRALCSIHVTCNRICYVDFCASCCSLSAWHVQDTNSFCRDVICDPDVVQYVNDSFVSWGGDIRRPDAFMVRLSITAHSAPVWWLHAGACQNLAYCVPQIREQIHELLLKRCDPGLL